MEYIIYCDESISHGDFFSDFYGGCIVSSRDVEGIVSALRERKQELGLKREIKWTKVTSQYVDKYISMIDLFFDYILSGQIRMRVMFRKTKDLPSNPALKTADDKFFKLYYQFIKHGFGLCDIPHDHKTRRFRIYLDQLPDRKDKCDHFKEMLYQMPQTKDFCASNIVIQKEDVADVDSHDHDLLQCVDIVLGAMQFRLNNLHKVIPEGQRTRAKKTIAKEKLYKHILSRICEIHPRFNIGCSTGNRGFLAPHWESPYEHWQFRPY